MTRDKSKKTEHTPSFLPGSGSMSVSNRPIAFIRPKFKPLKKKYEKTYKIVG
jgi:hypothetical protein